MKIDPTEDEPFYFKVETDNRAATRRWMVICDEGWRQSIVCDGMYQWAADWLVGRLQGQPYAPESKP